MRFFPTLLMGVSCGAALGIGAGALKWRRSAEQFHREARMAAILAQAQQMPKGGVLVIGDSIVERVWMPYLCGKPVLNAGIGWATSADWLPDAHKVIAAAKPSIVVMEIGANDHGRFERERHALQSLATFAVANPTSTVDGVHPDAKGAQQLRDEIEAGCSRLRSTHSPRAARRVRGSKRRHREEQVL